MLLDVPQTHLWGLIYTVTNNKADMDITEIILTIFGTGGLGFFVIQYILKHRDKKIEDKEAEKIETKEKIKNLNTKIDELLEERFQLSIKLARLEERILVHAKNKVKKNKREDD